MQWIVAVLIFVLGVACIAAGSTGNANALFQGITGIGSGAVSGASSTSASPTSTSSSPATSTSSSLYGGLPVTTGSLAA